MITPDTPETTAVITADQIPETLTVAQFANWQGMKLESIYAWLNSFEKPAFHYRIGRRETTTGPDRRAIRIIRDEFLKWRAAQIEP